jgi:hypothetical protein
VADDIAIMLARKHHEESIGEVTSTAAMDVVEKDTVDPIIFDNPMMEKQDSEQ